MSQAGESPHQKPALATSQLSLMSKIIFGSRWLQLPLYLGLIVAQCVYVFKFLKELVHLFSTRRISASSRSCWSCWA